ncbi:tRNA adenosine(34) deaminase TadA [Desulfobacterales bacterium HSG16]|nr:tRNA adenosine(34) deaminase TadA [Desulfobacterales bacterium HSG16]
MDHEFFMNMAIDEAQKAALEDEVPVGAVLTDETGQVIAAAHNRTISLCDPTAHAEILALRQAAKSMNNYRLPGVFIYTTIEPCMMCMAAMVHARVSLLVFGARDTKWGAAGSLYNFCADSRLNHRISVISGVCENECRDMITDFFRAKRRKTIANG